jgi:elongation factor 1-gamma
MASNQGKGTLYTFPGNFRAYKAQIAAQYSGAQLTVASEDKFKMNDTNRSEEYVKKFPTGKVPAYENDDGVHLFESNAIAHFLSNEQLRGKTPVEQSQVLQWIEYGEREINPASATLVYPSMGIMQFNKQNHERAKDELKHILQLLDNYLRTRTYLVGERITLADIAVACDLLLLFQWFLEPSLRESYPHATRWFVTLIHQKEFQAVLGADYKLCEKTAQFDAKKYADISRHEQVSQAQARPKNVSQSTDDGSESGKGKGGKKKGHDDKSAKEEAKPVKKEKTNEQNDDDAAAGGDETDDIYASEPKQNDPFAEMPKTSLNMDEFKRVYSNEDTAEKAIPYFWKNFDNENCSIWFCEYKFPEELTQVFMTCNLVSGFFQRLDKLRKNAFGSMCVFGENNNNTIAGIWVWRGHGLAFELSPDWKVDYDSYSWKRLSVDDEKTKQLVNQYLLWEGEHNGKKFNQGKIFK